MYAGRGMFIAMEFSLNIFGVVVAVSVLIDEGKGGGVEIQSNLIRES